ncbi:MAG: efflux RND transporter periplasmic adaptor subunit [Verrucomicrobiota bacterium]
MVLLGRLLALSGLLCLLGCGKTPSEEVKSPRPVTAIVLETRDPSMDLRLTGAVKAWNEEDIAFEVSGRVTFIAEAGTYLNGRWVDEGEVVQDGDVLARIDSEQYEVARLLAKSEVDTASADLKGVEDELKKLQSAGAAAVSQSAIDSMEADALAASAQVESAKARLRQADLDVRNTELWAPFDAEVSEVFVRAGGYARAGERVANLVMIDPVKIDVSVSAKTHRRLSEGDFVKVFVNGEELSSPAAVYQKSTVADPATRTFTVTVIIRNQVVEGAEGEELAEVPGIRRLMPLLHRGADDTEGPLFVEEDQGLYEASDGSHHIWVVAEPSLLTDGTDLTRTPFRIRKVGVELGEERFNMQGIYQFREIQEAEGVEVYSFSALEVPPELQEANEAEVVLRSRDWAMRPGSLVEVQFLADRVEPGFYVPLRAILPTGDEGRGVVFVVESESGNRFIARRILVDIGDGAGEMRRISGPELADGVRVVLEGASYLVDGEAVSIVKEETLSFPRS